ncbi:nitrogen regulation protein NR(II) [Halomonas denitrificans]|nr:PAS domain-containing sensor histidine kinase [Halomonas denitrificans]
MTRQRTAVRPSAPPDRRASADVRAIAEAVTAPEWLDHLQTALVVFGADGAVVRLNAAAEDLLAVSADRAARDPTFRGAVEASGLASVISRVRADGRPMASQDLAWSHPGGAEWLDARAARLPDGAILLELQDAAPRRRAMQDRDRQARRALSRRVVRQLAHEVRNPLAGLRGAAQLLARRCRGDDERELAAIVCDEADRLERLVEQLLGGSRAVEPRPGNVHEPVDRVMRLLAAGGESGLPEVRSGGRSAAPTFLRDFDPSLPRVSIDAPGLQQAVLNLARNACQAGARRITFRTRAASGSTLQGLPHRLAVAIEVEDDGPGVPEHLVDSLFFPLVTGRPDGTGLGLSIAQEIVDRHGGEIDHERRAGRTVFRILLPVQAGSRPSDRTGPSP